MLAWGEVWTSKFHTFSPITPQGLILYLGRKPLNYCSLLTMSHLHLSPLWLNKYPVIWQAQISFDLFISTCSWFGHFRVLSILMSFFFIACSNGGFGRNQSHKFIFIFLQRYKFTPYFLNFIESYIVACFLTKKKVTTLPKI